MKTIGTSYPLIMGSRVSLGMPHLRFVTAGSDLSSRMAHLRHIESELGQIETAPALQHSVIKKANEVFHPFGKAVCYGLIIRGQLFMSYLANPVNRTESLNVANHPPEHYPQEEIVLRAGREQVMVKKVEGDTEYLAFPLFRHGAVCGMLLLTNAASKKPFTEDDIKVVNEFALIASESMTQLAIKLSRS
ncbi:MAG TPA: GAF domain-containing protein [Candidatus Omnitrophota bacterium]|nr:GAF domain-containing protein [Candidatus Omnitrophota bacterium]